MHKVKQNAYTVDYLHLVKDHLNDENPYSVWGDGLDLSQFATAQEAFDYMSQMFPNGYNATIII